MANDTILTPGGDHWEPTPVQETTQYLERDNFLSEYETEGEKAVVRENLDVYNKASVYTRQESDIKLDESIKKAFDKYLNLEDPHGILPVVRQMIEGFVKEDGSTPFIAPQTGVDPVQDFHLTTKRFVTKILRDHLGEKDPHQILPEVENMLEQYVKQSQIYFKNQLYTKNEIDSQSNKYVRRDGTTSFTKAQIGVDPQIDSHLATKRYVDKVIYSHLVDIDPHGFVSLLNQRLASYAKVNNVYDKSQTYSRVQLDSIIRGLVGEAAKDAINDHLNTFDPHNTLAEVRKERYVKQDGTVPFKAPQKGVDAVDPQDLVTLHQLQEKTNQTVWLTSGPVKTTVGFVEDNTELTKKLSFQEIMDAIFYGKGISLSVPPIGIIGETVDITMCVHGSLATMDHGELYQNDKLLGTFTKENFEESSCITVPSDIIMEDTEFTFRLYHIHGVSIEEKAILKVAYPVFIGLLPKWKFGNTVTYDYLQQLSQEDPINNKFEYYPYDIGEIVHKYNFEDSKLQHVFVAVPAESDDLYQMYTPSQQFSKDAFDIIDMIPFQIPGANSDIIYKLYIYRQALASLNIPVTFKFETE